MTDEIQSLLLTELFVPNCKVKIVGDHFFADRKLYTNMYGVAFFSGSANFGENPHISAACTKLPGILDEYFGDVYPTSSASGEYELCDSVMSVMDKKYIEDRTSKKKLRWNTSCTFLGNLSLHSDGSCVLSYGTVLPTTLCFTENALSAILPFSPFSNISLLEGQRTLQSVDYPLPTVPFAPPEDITIDFSATAKKLSYSFSEDAAGKIELEYSIEVGVTKCEHSKMTFVITPYSEDQEDEIPL